MYATSFRPPVEEARENIVHAVRDAAHVHQAGGSLVRDEWCSRNSTVRAALALCALVQQGATPARALWHAFCLRSSEPAAHDGSPCLSCH